MDPLTKNERIGMTDMKDLLNKQGFKCAISGRPLSPDNCSLDHIMPLSRGGTHTLNNAQLVRVEVNHAKGQMTEEELLALCVDICHHKKLLK